jgi:hypothetical protein
MRWVCVPTLALAVLVSASATPYPLDGFDETGIGRLEAYWLARQVLLERGSLVPGSLWPTKDVRLRLATEKGFEMPAPDPEFDAAIRETLGSDAASYSIAVLDFTEPDKPRYAEINGSQSQNPASVGKVMVALAWFQALAELYPDDVEARNRILKETVITADGFIRKDSHVVPVYEPQEGRVDKRPIQEGDRANLWTYMDWMLSNSSSAAAAMLQAHLVLLAHFGDAYPVSQAEADAFFAETPKAELQRIFREATLPPLSKQGLDPEQLRQGSFFTREGKNRVPGTNSVASSRELMKLLVRMEQGQLVDWWSSMQLKRLLYLTDARARYASSSALDDSAVYFKSGSLYSCKPEEGFTCVKYQGNRYNYMNSIAVVETQEENGTLAYIAVVLSNVLRKDSVETHKALAAHIQELIEASHRPEAANQP